MDGLGNPLHLHLSPGNIHDVTEDVPGPDGREGLLFVGNFLHSPNPDAVHHLHDSIMPLVWAELPDLTLTIAGYKPSPEIEALASDRVKVVGHVPTMEP